MSLGHVMATVAVLAGLGLWAIFTQSSMIKLLIGLEVIARGATLAVVAAGVVQRQPGLAQVMAILIITIDAAVVALGLAMVAGARQHFGLPDVRRLTRLRG